MNMHQLIATCDTHLNWAGKKATIENIDQEQRSCDSVKDKATELQSDYRNFPVKITAAIKFIGDYSLRLISCPSS